jgi:hypothetical protein
MKAKLQQREQGVKKRGKDLDEFYDMAIAEELRN